MLPPDRPKVASMRSSRESCIAVLDEVDVFLEKHSRIGTDKKRLIDTAKFITKDIDGLKSKLTHSSTLLQLSLSSLTR